MSSKVRYYTDENVAKAVVHGLRRRGVDVLTVTDAKMLGASDEEHLKLACKEKRVIFTHDKDFLRLSTIFPDHYGIVHTSRKTSIGVIIYGLMLIYQVLTPEDMKNNIEYL